MSRDPPICRVQSVVPIDRSPTKSFDWTHRAGSNRLISGPNMPPLERVWEDRNRTPVLLVSAAIIGAIALVDWWTKPYVSLGFLYLFPIMLAAGFLPRWAVGTLGVVCAILAEVF